MATGTSSRGSSSKRSRNRSTSSRRLKSRRIGTGLGPMITVSITPLLLDGLLMMRMETHISTGSLFEHRCEWINLLEKLTHGQTQAFSTQLWEVMIAGLTNLHLGTTINLLQSPKSSNRTE